MSPSWHRINFWQMKYIAVDQLGAKCIESSFLNSMKMDYYLVQWSIVSFLRVLVASATNHTSIQTLKTIWLCMVLVFGYIITMYILLGMSVDVIMVMGDTVGRLVMVSVTSDVTDTVDRSVEVTGPTLYTK